MKKTFRFFDGLSDELILQIARHLSRQDLAHGFRLASKKMNGIYENNLVEFFTERPSTLRHSVESYQRYEKKAFEYSYLPHGFKRAYKEKNIEALKRFLTTKKVDEDGNTPMHLIGNWSNIEVLDLAMLLLNLDEPFKEKLKFILNLPNDLGDTPLHLLARNKLVCVKALSYFIQLGANPMLKNKAGQTADMLTLDAKQKFLAMTRLLPFEHRSPYAISIKKDASGTKYPKLIGWYEGKMRAASDVKVVPEENDEACGSVRLT